MMFDFFYPTTQLAPAVANLQSWASLIAAFAIILGTLSLIMSDIAKISKKTSGYALNILSLAVMFTFIIFGLALGPSHTLYQYWYSTIIIPLSIATSSLMGFFMLSGSYRTIKGTTLDGVVLIIVVIAVLLGTAPIGGYVWTGFPALNGWILEVPNTAGQRAILIGLAVASIVLGARVMLGLERAHFR
jgi:hypothetical protein